MSDLSMTIDGKAGQASDSFGVADPATGEEFARAPECSREQLDLAFDAAQRAYLTWRVDEQARRAALAAVADTLKAAANDIAPVLTREQGKPIRDATIEIHGMAHWMRYYADLEISRQVIQDDKKGFVELIRRPMGVVSAITPWNYPLMLGAWKIAAGLRAGNTMVLKPSPFTPLSTLMVGEVLRDVLPAGVLNVVSGGDQLGAWMTQHPVPRKISFTGSVSTGKKIASTAAATLRRCTLELGGNDAAIVLDDADTADVASQIFGAAFMNNGQVCCAIKRVYVPERRYGEMVEALAAQAKGARVGRGTDEGVELGPINNKPQYDRVSGLVDNAVAAGAVVAAGGHCLGEEGYFYAPTILAGLSEGTAIVDEEQFGPALPVMSYTDLDDAVERANNTEFGLCGSVWGTDADIAAQIAERLECGTAWINSHGVLGPHQPFGGWKSSGLGVENGIDGLLGFTESQVVHRAKR